MDGPARPTDRRSHLPHPLTPFVGRERELADLGRLLRDPACRLVTLVGPGGFGKTRLALQAAAAAEPPADGAFFVGLRALPAAGLLAQALADAVGLPLTGAATPPEQVRAFLRDKTCRLLLDNGEVLLDSSAAANTAVEQLAGLLEAAPGLQLLITSRQALNVLGEWRYPVGGLACPPADADPDQALETYGAVRLFVQTARRVRPDFSLAEEAAAVARLCRQVAGMPLALELAAAWTKTLPCTAIADQIAESADLLQTDLRYLPAQHRSVPALLQGIWDRLPAEAQGVFRRLSVFPAAFELAAAVAVADATLPGLAALLDQALLTRDADGRYYQHELLRQFAEARLAEAPDAAEARRRHASYYAAYLRGWHADIKGGQQAEAARHVAENLDNIRAAWRWMVAHADADLLGQAADTLHCAFQYHSRYAEGAEAFAQAAQSLTARDPHHPVLAELLVYQGWMCLRLGRFAEARAALETSWAILTALNRPPEPGAGRDPVNALGILASIVGDYAEAQRLGEAARRAHTARGDAGNLMDTYYVLTSAALALGQYEAARRHAEAAYALAESISDRWMMAYILNDLGSVARAMGDYARARQHFQASYDLRQAFSDPEGMAVALSHLGRVARLQADYAEAQALYTRSCALYREINDRGGLATALLGMGEAALKLGAFDTARLALREALQNAVAIAWWPFSLNCLVVAAELWRRVGAPEQAVPVLTLAARHPGTDRETREAAVAGLVDLMETLPADRFATAQARLPAAPETAQGVEDTARAALSALAAPLGQPPTPPAERLAEPLTERERQVLRLVAEGLKNQEIADRLVITRGTVRIHVNNIYRKLDVNNRVQAVARGRALSLL